ncbi:hypothetical protein BVG16_05400 [Paenibacillus selenitireducens]|uniref:Uncharacterized protein n=2 Tax=Paenibacillus selenitireducens TaxID=1324314 RepID=A0A1T2XK38_9BACL|nr:hypothetical protein BVG16_05400 [Paenibacillus selenitireducens]
MTELETNAMIEGYFQHFTDFDVELRRISIYAGLTFRNQSNETLDNPEIILQISPGNVGKLSGKVLSPSLISVYGMYMKSRNGSPHGWSFTREDWSSHGKKTGEYRIQSIEPLQLTPGSSFELKEIQMDFNFPKHAGTIQIDAYLFIRNQMYSVWNPICIHLYGAAQSN